MSAAVGIGMLGDMMDKEQLGESQGNEARLEFSL